ncbi:MAG TPA: cation diffusion facilitator family transporter [Vicinamibacteria bacterium]|nr:cation diffusion facilitator family transporter [Vicinamibacteria bacterium]
MQSWLAIRRVLFIEGTCNVAVFLAKLSVGLSTGSLALVGDAIHSLADLANNLVALVVVRLSSQPPDREHPYGHQKFETLAVFGLAVLLSVLAVEIILRAVARSSEPVLEHPWGLGVMVGVLFVNAGVAAWERRWARRLDSAILDADAKHTFADVLITSGVIIGWQFAARGYPWLDRLVALGVALAVMNLAYGLFRRAVPVLVDRIAHAPEALAAAVRPIDGVVEVRRVRSRWAGTRPEADVVISVAAELSTRQAHDVADAIERVLSEKFSIHDAVVHVEPELVDAAAKDKSKPSSSK